MGHRKIIDQYYADIGNTSDILTKLVSSYRLLIGGAAELNTITLAKPNEVKDALDLVDDLGEIIEDYLKVLEKISPSYFDYCKMESEIIKGKLENQYILTEIDEELKLKD